MTTRPLTGEPVALDLVNTEWIDGGARRDHFAEAGQVRDWLAEHGLSTDGSLPEVTDALRVTRRAIRGVLERRPGAVADLNTVLARGRVRLVMGDDGTPGESVEIADQVWRPAWLVARRFVELIREAPPERVRKCANPACVLWFHDTSRNNTRRWCSMAGCGNRAKARAHYHRSRGD